MKKNLFFAAVVVASFSSICADEVAQVETSVSVEEIVTPVVEESVVDTEETPAEVTEVATEEVVAQ